MQFSSILRFSLLLCIVVLSFHVVEGAPIGSAPKKATSATRSPSSGSKAPALPPLARHATPPSIPPKLHALGEATVAPPGKGSTSSEKKFKSYADVVKNGEAAAGKSSWSSSKALASPALAKHGAPPAILTKPKALKEATVAPASPASPGKESSSSGKRFKSYADAVKNGKPQVGQNGQSSSAKGSNAKSHGARNHAKNLH